MHQPPAVPVLEEVLSGVLSHQVRLQDMSDRLQAVAYRAFGSPVTDASNQLFGGAQMASKVQAAPANGSVECVRNAIGTLGFQSEQIMTLIEQLERLA